MIDFSLLDKISSFARENRIPVYGIAMYNGEELREAPVVPANECNDLYSGSKSFTSTAVGICVTDGILSLNETVYDIFKDIRPDMNPLWKKVTVERVISQTVGIAGMFLDIDTEDMFAPPYAGRDWLDVVLEHPFVTEPGTKFAYSDSNFYLASRIVAKVTGRPMQELLAERLFNPLKMQGWAWSTCPNGHAMGGTGLFVRVKDFAKLGALYLNDGEYEGVRVVSKEFARRATSVVAHCDEHTGYGLGFWILGKNPATFQASGMYNQISYVNRDAGCVIAWEGHDTNGKIDLLRRFLI